MARNNFKPVFEETETSIRERLIAKVEADGWRAEKGDFMYDAVNPSPAEVKQLQINQDTILAGRFAKYAESLDLDDCLDDVGLTRIAASANKRALLITADAGVVIQAAQLLYAVVLDNQGQPLKFDVDAAVNWVATGAQVINITCKTLGTIGNLATGSQFILQPSIPGIRTIVDQGTTVVARDVESDTDAWGRYEFKVNHVDTGGNKNDYVRWAGEVAGVGKTKCVPRWNGVNTVKVVLVGNDFTPATPLVVADAQAYLDPGAAGMGEGKAPCGAAVTAAAADSLAVNITVTGIQYSAGAIPADVKATFETSVRDYLKVLVFEVDQAGDPLSVIYNRILGLLTFTQGVSNFTGITINGAQADLAVTATQAPSLGAVTGL